MSSSGTMRRGQLRGCSRLVSVVACAVIGLTLSADARCRGQAPQVSQALITRSSDFVQEVEAGYGTLCKLTTGPAGGVSISAWKKRTIRVEAHIEVAAPTEADLALLGSVVGISIDPSATRVAISTLGPHDKSYMKAFKKFPKLLKTMPWRIDYTLHVPEFTALDIAVYNGNTTVEGVTGIMTVVSTQGDISFSNVSGSAQANAVSGRVDVVTHERSWHGGNLAVIAGHGATLTFPHGFSAWFDLQAPAGISLSGEKVEQLGPSFKGAIGAGGGGVTVSSGDRITVIIGEAPP